MSRIGKQPIAVPSGVNVNMTDGEVVVRGSRGELRFQVHTAITVRMDDGNLLVERSSDNRLDRSLHGLTRALLANMVTGVDAGGTILIFTLGFFEQQTVAAGGWTHNLPGVPNANIQASLEKITDLGSDVLRWTAKKVDPSVQVPDGWRRAKLLVQELGVNDFGLILVGEKFGLKPDELKIKKAEGG